MLDNVDVREGECSLEDDDEGLSGGEGSRDVEDLAFLELRPASRT